MTLSWTWRHSFNDNRYTLYQISIDSIFCIRSKTSQFLEKRGWDRTGQDGDRTGTGRGQDRSRNKKVGISPFFVFIYSLLFSNFSSYDHEMFMRYKL